MKNYTNEQVRRQDRLLDENLADELVRKGEYGVLSMVTPEGEGYGIPVNYVWDENLNALYIHCAPQGRKLTCLAHQPLVTFTIIGRTGVVLACTAHTGQTAEERMKALELILDKYAPDDKTVGLKYTEKSFHRTEIIRLDIRSASGKCKVVR